jgi:hypothetical protein
MEQWLDGQYDSVDKSYEMILYIADRFRNAPRYGMTKLWKVLFWSDFRHYQRTGQAITRRDYIKLPNGPVPDRSTAIINTLEARSLIRVEHRPTGSGTQQRVVPLRQVNREVLTADEWASVDAAIAENYDLSAEEASDLSHEFIGWQIAAMYERIPYATAFLGIPEMTEAEEKYALELARRLGV